MHDRAPVFRHELHGGVQTRLWRVRIGVLPDDLIGAFGDDLCRKRGNVCKVIIKCIAVDAAVLHDRLDRDLTERTLVEQLQKRSFNGLVGVSGHSLTSCAAAQIHINSVRALVS